MTKKSWIQKIRGYDELEARCKSAEAMRDHNREMADAWQERAATQEALATVWEGVAKWVCKRPRVIGRRLKFSVGHNHTEIIIGNPVTVAENYNAENARLKEALEYYATPADDLTNPVQIISGTKIKTHSPDIARHALEGKE